MKTFYIPYLKKFLILIIPSLATFLTNGQTNLKSTILAGPVKVTSVEGITEYNLANGLRVLLFPDPSKPTITVNVTYLVGSRVEGYGETGMAHLLEHMVFKGSTKHKDVPKELTDHGAYPNGSTWYDRTNYFETFSASDENLKWAIDLESDRMVNSFIADKDLKSEFSVVRNEFEAGENRPSSVLMERVFSTAYLWHNYGKSTIGSKEDIEKVPVERLQAFYKKYYQPDNAVLMIAGKIDEAKTIQLVNQYFGRIPKPTRKLDASYTLEPEQDGERSVTLRRVADVQVVSCAYHIPSGIHPDFAAIDILSEVLANQPSGRLYKALIEGKKASSQYAYAFSLKDPGVIYFSADVLKEKSIDEARNTMLNVLDSVTIKPVTSEELERARNTLLKNFELAYRNSENIGLTISEYIAQGDWRTGFIYRDNMKKVTLEDVNRAANAYFKNSNRTVGVFIPEKNPDRSIIPPTPDVAAMVKGYKGQQALASAEAFDANPTSIDKRTKTGSITGGAKYAILAKTTRGSSVNMHLTLRVGDESTLQNKRVLTSVTAEMLRRGTQNKNFQQLNDELDKLQSRLYVYGDGQNISISMESTKANFGKVLALAKEMLRQPSFPQKELDAIVQEKLADIEQQKSDPEGLANNMRDRIMSPYPKGHPNSTLTFDEQVTALKNIKLEDITTYYHDFLNSTHATVGVVGDCDETATIQSLTSMLENWNSRYPFAHIEMKYFDVAATDQKVNTPDKKNAVFYASQNIQMNDADPDYASIIMGNFILGGGFLNSRLATRLRQKDGLSYGVGSWVNANALDKSAFFGSYAIYNPENLDKLEKAYKEELNKILKEGINASELKAAKGGYLQTQQINRSQDGYLAYKLNNSLFLKRTISWEGVQEKQIENLTVEQVNNALKKHINPDKITYIKAGSFDKQKAL